MYVCGFISRTFTRPLGVSTSPSRITDWNLARSGPNDQRRAISSAAMKPMLWRFFSYFGPGLPRPARMIMGGGLRIWKRPPPIPEGAAPKNSRSGGSAFRGFVPGLLRSRNLGLGGGFRLLGLVGRSRDGRRRGLDRGDHEVAVRDGRLHIRLHLQVRP